jgi:hypothetical protein
VTFADADRPAAFRQCFGRSRTRTSMTVRMSHWKFR